MVTLSSAGGRRRRLPDVKMRVERVVVQPVGVVAPFFIDASNNPVWQAGMVSCEWTTEPPIQVGSTYDQRAEFRGRPITTTFEVTQYQPERLIRVESTESSFPVQVTRRVEPIDGEHCLVSADISGQPRGLMRLLAGIGSRKVRRTIEADYDRLVEHFR